MNELHVTTTTGGNAVLKEASLNDSKASNAFAEDFEQGIKDAFRPQTYARLAALKQKYDPTNFLRINPNIQPGG